MLAILQVERSCRSSQEVVDDLLCQHYKPMNIKSSHSDDSSKDKTSTLKS